MSRVSTDGIGSGSRWVGPATVGAVLLAVLALSASAQAQPALSLSVSSPRIEGAPITFTVAGIAAGEVRDGESTEFLQGAVLRANQSCPTGGADSYGDIPHAFAETFHAFPTGPFRLTYRMRPNGIDPQTLPAGKWHECVYLQDRGSNAVVTSAEQAFTVRKPHVRVALKRPLPRHINLHRDSIGRPTGFALFTVRARVELPGRRLQVIVARPESHKSCAELLRGYSMADGLRLSSGGARTYRVHVPLVFRKGPMPYGRRVRVCAMVHIQDPRHGTDLIEGSARSRLLLRR